MNSSKKYEYGLITLEVFDIENFSMTYFNQFENVHTCKNISTITIANTNLVQSTGGHACRMQSSPAILLTPLIRDAAGTSWLLLTSN